LEIVIASEAKQSILPFARRHGLLRFARNDGKGKYDSAISRRGAPEVCKSCFASLRIEGAGNAGRSMRPQPRMQNKTKHTSIVTTVTPEITRHSPRNGFTAYFALSPVTTLV
jgi:hypothetical protein